MERNILFLCTGNSARSQMGEALLNARAGNTFRAFSAGTTPQDRIFPPVVEVMREIGIDISGNTPKGIKTFLGHYHFERVIIVCGDAEKQCPAIFGMSKREFWPFDDPAAAQGSEQDVLAVARRVRDQIDGSICEWLQAKGIPVQPLGSS